MARAVSKKEDAAATKSRGKSKSKILLKKHSALVQMKNVPTAGQRKLLNTLLQIAGERLRENQNTRMFTTSFNEIRHRSGMQKETNYQRIKEALEGLANVNVKYNVLDKDKEIEWGVFALVSEAKVRSDGSVTFAFPPTIHDNILFPSMFAVLNTGIINGLRSKYAIALYELLQDYRRIGMVTMTIDEFRELMALEHEYTEFSMLRRRIIHAAVKEINRKTDMRVSYECIKDGRKYTDVTFLVSSATSLNREENSLFSQVHEVDSEIPNAALAARLRYYGIAEQRAIEYAQSKTEAELSAAIKMFEKRYERGGVENPAGLLIYFLDNVVISNADRQAPALPQFKTSAAAGDSRQEEILRELERLFRRHCDKLISERCADSAVEEIEDFISQYEGNSIVLDQLRNADGEFDHELISHHRLFLAYLYSRYIDEEAEFMRFARSRGFIVARKEDGFVIVGEQSPGDDLFAEE